MASAAKITSESESEREREKEGGDKGYIGPLESVNLNGSFKIHTFALTQLCASIPKRERKAPKRPEENGSCRHVLVAATSFLA